MKILIVSMKGGTGKSSLAVSLQELLQYQIITNDKGHPYNLILKEEQYFLLPDNMEIPSYDNMIYDFGGFSDTRLFKFIEKNQDMIIIIPFNPDVVSFQSAIRTFNEIKNINNNIIFVLNRAKAKDYEIFLEQMKKMNINKALLEFKESKLFQNIFNKKQKINDVKENKLLKHSYKQVFEQMDNLIEELKK